MGMVRYVAFLRGINVGGHTVKMDVLRRQFEGLGFADVSTFIASGNVVFQTQEEGADPAALEQRIERALRAALGYEVATFLRTDAEVAQVAAYTPFADLPVEPGDSSYVIFLRTAPDAVTGDRVSALSNERDLLRVGGRELYWLRRGSLLESTINSATFDRALGAMPTTMRNAKTLRRLAAKYPVTPS
jgi:uncharacterized protein (DUF1697 family)